MKINVAKLFSRSNTTLLNTIFIELMGHSFHEDFTDPVSRLRFFATSSLLIFLCYFLSTCISFFHSDLLVTALFTPNSSIPQDHLPKYTYLLGYAVSVFEQWEEVSCSRYLFQPSDIFHIETTHFGLQCISDNWFLYGMRHL